MLCESVHAAMIETPSDAQLTKQVNPYYTRNPTTNFGVWKESDNILKNVARATETKRFESTTLCGQNERSSMARRQLSNNFNYSSHNYLRLEEMAVGPKSFVFRAISQPVAG